MFKKGLQLIKTVFLMAGFENLHRAQEKDLPFKRLKQGLLQKQCSLENTKSNSYIYLLLGTCKFKSISHSINTYTNAQLQCDMLGRCLQTFIPFKFLRLVF